MSTEFKFNSHTGLVLIDVQKAFNHREWGSRNNPGAETQISVLLTEWRNKGLPIFHVRHASSHAAGLFREGEEGFEFKPEAKPMHGEPVYTKSVNSSFIGTRLEADLRARGVDTLVIVGLTTNHCVSTTARMSGNFGFRTLVVEDATATFDRMGMKGEMRPAQEVHEASLSDLSEEFATIVSTAEVLESLAQMAVTDTGSKVKESTAPLPASDIASPAAQAYIERITGHLQGRQPLEVLRNTVAVIEELVNDSSAEALEKRSGPGKWSANEILAHLADAETVLGFRLRQILSQDGIAIASFDQDLWAAVSNYQAIPASRSGVRLGVNRAANLEVIEKLTPAQMTMYGVHSERGPESVAHLLRMWAGHDLNHLSQLRTLLAR